MPSLSQPIGITVGPDGAPWFTELDGNKIARASACGLGFSASFSGTTLTLNFNLGIDTSATFNIFLENSTGPFAEPFSKAISAVVPPHSFAMDWTSFPNLGMITVQPVLASGPGQPICSEWTMVDTAP